MNIVSLKIKNVLSISDVEIKPGQVNQIVGANSQGKTSILKALEGCVKGFTDQSVIKHGEDSAEVLLELSDGTHIRRRINSEGRQSVEVKRDGAKFSAPQTVLDVLFDTSSFNPIELLDPKKRNDAILKSIELKVTDQDLGVALGLPVKDLPPLDYSGHGLKVLEAAYKFFYQRRAEANRVVAEKKARYETYKTDLPPLPTAPELNLVSIQVKKNEIAEEISFQQDQIRKINRQHEDAKSAQKKVDSYRAEAEKIDKEISDLESKIMAAKERRGLAQKFIEEAILSVPTSLLTTDVHEANIVKAKENVQQFDLMVKDWQTFDAVAKQHDMVKSIQNEYDQAVAHAEHFDKVVILAGTTGKTLMASAEMPITGLTYREGQFYVDGIAVDNLSSSAALKLAVAVARKLSKKSKIICIDGAEQLDEETYQSFRQAIHEDGFTYFLTKVGFQFETSIDGDRVIGMEAGNATVLQ